MIHEQSLQEYPAPAAPANLSREPEAPFQHLLAAAMQEVFERVAADEQLPQVKFDVNKATGSLRDVRLLYTADEGVSEQQDVVYVGKRPYASGKPYKLHHFTGTEVSMAAGEQVVESVERRTSGTDTLRQRIWPDTYMWAEPEGLARGFLNAAKTPEEIDAVLDVVCSDAFKSAAQDDPDQALKLGAPFGNSIAKFVLGNPDMMPQVQASLLRHMGESTGSVDFSGVIHRIDSSLSRRLVDGLNTGNIKTNDAILQQAADFLAPFEALDMLVIDQKGYHGALAYVELISQKPFTELLLRNLVRRPITEQQKQTEQGAFIARMFLQKKLDQFADDPERHSGNVAIIRQRLFPDQSRSNSLSRVNLVNLSNAITTSRNAGQPKDKQKPLIDAAKPGGVAEALENVLNITTANNASASTAEQHRVENNLISDIVGMLLESRYRPGDSLEESEVTVAALATYVRARERTADKASVWNLKRPGYGPIS